MSKQSTIDTITGLAVSFGASKATFNEGTFYTGDANVSGLIKVAEGLVELGDLSIGGQS